MTKFLEIFQEQMNNTPFLTREDLDVRIQARRESPEWEESEIKTFEEELLPKIGKEKQLYFFAYDIVEKTGKIRLEVHSFWSGELDEIEREYELVEKIYRLPKLKKKNSVY